MPWSFTALAAARRADAQPRAAAPVPAPATARPAPAEPLASAEALDQRTLWPVHRIRWFLLSQPTLIRSGRPR
jgi:hypothetical protein